MKIAYNPLAKDALTTAPSNNDITFDLAGIAIYAKGVKFKGTDTTYSVFKKHTSDNKGGYNGLVPVPSYTTTTTRYLREDGTWVVPTNTTYNVVSSSANGLAPKVINTNTATVGSAYYVLASTDGSTSPSWYKLPANAFKNDNTTYTFVSGNGGFTVTPSGGTAQVVSIGKVDWANITNKPDTFTPSAHTHATDNITKLTSYTKATSASDLATTDTLNTALGKLEYKADYAYDWIIGVTASDTDEYINKWGEIVGFLDSVKEGTDILDEFVTRKTTQTITGAKTFESNSSTTGISLILKNKGWAGSMSTAVDFYNGNLYTVPNARIETKMVGAGNTGGTLIFYTQTKHASTNPNPNGLVERLRIADDALVTISGLTVTNTLKISDTTATGHLIFSRGSYNYITAPSGGRISFCVNGNAAGSAANSEFTIEDGAIVPGTTNVTSLGTSNLRWSNIYSTAGNFTGNLSLYTASGDSPALVFHRGAIGTDTTVDWRIYVTSGHLKIQNALSSYNSGAWSDVLHFDADLTNKTLKSSYNIVPTTNNTLTLGTSSLRWSGLYSNIGNFSGNVTSTGFVKSGSSDSYVLLGGGGHKALSNFMLKSDELTNNLTTITKTLTVTASWMDTGIEGGNIAANGTYVVQVYAHNSADSLYYCYWSGIMTWYKDGTNDSDSDEIILHRSGHAYGNTIYLRTIMNSNGKLKLQIAANKALANAIDYTFKFKRVI